MMIYPTDAIRRSFASAVANELKRPSPLMKAGKVYWEKG